MFNQVSDEDVTALQNKMDQQNLNVYNFSSFTYNARQTDRSISVQLSMQMFSDLDYMNRFKIRKDKLARFLLIVQKGYRDTIPYHNWTHAFSVSHFAYSLLMNLSLTQRNILTYIKDINLSCPLQFNINI